MHIVWVWLRYSRKQESFPYQRWIWPWLFQWQCTISYDIVHRRRPPVRKAMFIRLFRKYSDIIVVLKKPIPCYSQRSHMVTEKKMVLSIILTRTNKKNVFIGYSDHKYISLESFMKEIEKKLFRTIRVKFFSSFWLHFKFEKKGYFCDWLLFYAQR